MEEIKSAYSFIAGFLFLHGRRHISEPLNSGYSTEIHYYKQSKPVKKFTQVFRFPAPAMGLQPGRLKTENGLPLHHGSIDLQQKDSQGPSAVEDDGPGCEVSVFSAIVRG
jgi:hypothetical protein